MTKMFELAEAADGCSYLLKEIKILSAHETS